MLKYVKIEEKKVCKRGAEEGSIAKSTTLSDGNTLIQK